MLNWRPPHFLDVFSSNLSFERLRIPTRFVKHMEGKTCGSAALMGPSGDTWRVDLIKQDGDLYLHRGWSVFVRDNCVESGDYLVFRYDGELHFSVQVFDQSACEKEAAFNSKCSQDCGKKREWEEAADVCLDIVIEGVQKKLRQFVEVATPSATVSCNDRNATEYRIGEEENLSMQYGSCMSVFSETEEKKIAKSFTSCFPYFVRIMKRFNVSGSYTLNIPYQFSMAHLPNCKTEIILRNLKGACWTVNSVPTTRVHTSHTLCGGWLAFVRSNEIKMGDICIFELVRRCELRVNILRVGKENPDSQIGQVASNGLNGGSTAASHRVFEGKMKNVGSNSQKVHSKSMKTVQIRNKKGSKRHSKNSASVALSSQSRTGNRKPEAAIQRRNNVEADAIDGMRMMVALDEEKAAKSFCSSFPNFVRIMRKFNISGSYTLKVPNQFAMAHLPYCKTEIVLRNMRGECWTVNSIPDSKGRVTHTFCGGWMAFVRDNDIKMGDICMFELVSKSEMRVHISGDGQKGLEHQWGRSAPNELPTGSSTILICDEHGRILTRT
ncbi:B3 domain-containing protein [Cephalotus follicularis]|uniref:B3 domain-containing protein n=1 Tax=Cephalotus follicularis TaxID=3775 RepID=A0A1Q3CJU4_CEPFO|nr:B3 domain-containing protein [Cephalotus follicularis]